MNRKLISLYTVFFWGACYLGIKAEAHAPLETIYFQLVELHALAPEGGDETTTLVEVRAWAHYIRKIINYEDDSRRKIFRTFLASDQRTAIQSARQKLEKFDDSVKKAVEDAENNSGNLPEQKELLLKYLEEVEKEVAEIQKKLNEDLPEAEKLVIIKVHKPSGKYEGLSDKERRFLKEPTTEKLQQEYAKDYIENIREEEQRG